MSTYTGSAPREVAQAPSRTPVQGHWHLLVRYLISGSGGMTILIVDSRDIFRVGQASPAGDGRL